MATPIERQPDRWIVGFHPARPIPMPLAGFISINRDARRELL